MFMYLSRFVDTVKKESKLVLMDADGNIKEEEEKKPNPLGALGLGKVPVGKINLFAN